MKLNLATTTLTLAAFITAATAVTSFGTISESYAKINAASPELDARTKARLAWLDAARQGEIVYCPSLQGEKRRAVDNKDLADKGLTANDGVIDALKSVGLNYNS